MQIKLHDVITVQTYIQQAVLAPRNKVTQFLDLEPQAATTTMLINPFESITLGYCAFTIELW